MKTLSRAVLGVAVLGLAAVAVPSSASAAPPATERQVTDIVPVPVEAKADPSASFRLTPGTVIRAGRGTGDVAAYLRELLKPATGYPLPVLPASAGLPAISLELGKADPRVGDEGYQLTVAKSGVRLRANTAAGLFEGVQSLRQLLPSEIESKTVRQRSWTIAGGTVLDYPRFGYRSAMLDVARHFFAPDQVKQYIDRIAQYKINTLHLHLSDDQGWRIEIKSWPRLATEGGKTAAYGDPGGYYTQAQYRDLVAYAASRHITVVPEIDMPGHTNAAQATYAELNCDGVAVPPRTDIEVGYSSLCIGSPTTYRFVEDVIRELAAITPGKYLHLGGDEAHSTSDADYRTFYEQVAPLAAKYGKLITGWHEIVKSEPPASAIPQYWDQGGPDADVTAAAERGNKFLMSPSNHAYLDMKYDASTPLGQDWAGLVEVRDAYDWDPADLVPGVGEQSVAGVEAPLWTETLRTADDLEYMAFPRLPGIAEIGWSPQASRSWDSYRARLAKQATRWEQQGIGFYRSPQVDWP
ncbi:beta-N-acetylhexosaminidase [Amycolatopsis jiangsuensis]|uniref:beta-N-acetylhexosaminidase n=1 Tax=Amycolatopsis jiangsuensis TaxID=1181879 RepID=A0A840J4B9_9PSEU|nr:beta-N-acetylhexosaminidase [Amycolatopsis jiangsuensis]MBB4688248.1 hexosaminidase [Amycolatopsis jiangsuensis]